MHQDAEQEKQLLDRADTAREDDDAVRDPHERLEALLDVGHDHELVDDRVWRFCGDNARLRDADVATVTHPLFGMPDRRPFHRAFHGAGTATGADVQQAQPELVANFLREFVFLAPDRMTSPADNQVRIGRQAEYVGVS